MAFTKRPFISSKNKQITPPLPLLDETLLLDGILQLALNGWAAVASHTPHADAHTHGLQMPSDNSGKPGCLGDATASRHLGTSCC